MGSKTGMRRIMAPSPATAVKMRISESSWELMLLAGLASLGLGVALAQEDALFETVFAVEAGIAAVEAFYLAAPSQ